MMMSDVNRELLIALERAVCALNSAATWAWYEGHREIAIGIERDADIASAAAAKFRVEQSERTHVLAEQQRRADAAGDHVEAI
jgi:hypothetical protein